MDAQRLLDADMTVGWAAECSDGVVVATDSLRHQEPGDGSTGVIRLSGKLQWFSPRVAVVTSGSFTEDVFSGDERLNPTAELDDAKVADVLPSVRRRLEETAIGVDERHRHPLDAGIASVYEALVGGGRRGSRPELFVVRGDGQPPERLEQQIVLTACLRGWARRRGVDVVRPNPALDVVATAQLAIDMLRECVRDLFRDLGRDRWSDFFEDRESGRMRIPPAAFPIHVALITADRSAEYVVEDCDLGEPAALAGA